MILVSTFRQQFRALPHRRFISSYFFREPSSSASRLVPTPLVFLSASQWHSPNRFRDGFARMYPERGYTCLDVDLSLPTDTQDAQESQRLMQNFESQLRSAVSLSMIPFPPVIISSDAACLASQTYISSHPATGLVLISPPPSNEVALQSGILPTPLPEFNFEPKFPILIVATQGQMDLLQNKHRLLRDGGVDNIVVDDVEGQNAFIKIEQWLDEIGI